MFRTLFSKSYIEELLSNSWRFLSRAFIVLGYSASALPIASANVGQLPWHQSHQLLANDGANGDQFGSAVNLDNGVAIVGAPEHGLQGSNAGAAYLLDTISGTQTHKLLATDQMPYDQYTGDKFGFSVALDGNRALVSAPLDDEFGPDSGAIYAFDLHPVTGVPTQTQKLLPLAS